MTKLGKILVVIISCASICFFAFAAASSTAMQDVRGKYKTLSDRKIAVDKEKSELMEMRPTVVDLEARIADAKATAAADKKAMEVRAEVLLAQSKALHNDFIAISKQRVMKGGETEVLQQEADRLRNEIGRLADQLQFVRVERLVVEKDKLRLENLLVQAEGMLERARQRKSVMVNQDGANSSYGGPAAPTTSGRIAPALEVPAPAVTKPAPKTPDADVEPEAEGKPDDGEVKPTEPQSEEPKPEEGDAKPEEANPAEPESEANP